jgi:hypothetical protein
MLKDIVKNPEEQSVRGPSEAKHERDGQSRQDVGQLAEAGNGSSKMVFAQRSHAKDIGPQAWSPSDHFDGKRFFNPTLPTAALRGARILIVEDESILALDLENRLTREGCDVIGLASREAKALKLLEREQPDAVVLDLNLNGKLPTDLVVPWSRATSSAMEDWPRIGARPSEARFQSPRAPLRRLPRTLAWVMCIASMQA